MKVFQFLVVTGEDDELFDSQEVYVAAKDLHAAINFIETNFPNYIIKMISVYDRSFYIAVDDD